MEFYYNCSMPENNKVKNTEKPSKKIQTSEFKDSVQPIVKTVYSNSLSIIEVVILAVGIICLLINIVQLYCMYRFSKYLDS